MSVHAAVAFLALAATAHAADDLPLVQAQTDIVAALGCDKLGYPYMARLSSQQVVCLPNKIGVTEAIRVIDVKALLRRRP